MRYLGGKYRIAKHIARCVNGHPGTVFLEPFMGSCWVTAQINYPHRLVGDIHNELVMLYHRVVHEGWEPPEVLSAEDYFDIRANRASGKYPPELVAFAAFGCTFGGACWRKYAGESYAARSKRSILKKVPHLNDVRFYTSDYCVLRPKGCIIYCDPPYAGKYTYRITGVKGNGRFDHNKFWKIMDDWSQDNLVFISELTAPKDYECIMSVTTKSSMHATVVEREEKLFCKNRNVELIQEPEINPLHILGVQEDWDGFK